MQDVMQYIANYGVAIVIVGVYLFKDIKYTDKILTLVQEIKALVERMDKEHHED